MSEILKEYAGALMAAVSAAAVIAFAVFWFCDDESELVRMIADLVDRYMGGAA